MQSTSPLQLAIADRIVHQLDPTYDEPLIITGPPRTGTTALSAGLSLHPTICIVNEVCLYHPENWAGWRLSKLPDGYFWKSHVDHVWPSKCPSREQTMGTIDRHMNNAEVRSWLFGTTEKRIGRPLSIYGDNMPGAYLKHLGAIAELYPKAKILVTIRDGRDVVASQVRHYHNSDRPIENQDWRAATVEEASPLWLRYMKTWERWRSEIAVDRWMEVRYEEATSDPSSMVRAILELMGVEYVESEFAEFFSFYRPVHVGTWRQTLPNLERELSDEFKEMLDRWGYAW